MEVLTKPRNVWVLHGGFSSEREVSLRSGQGIANALRHKGYSVELFDFKSKAELQALPWTRLPDVVFPALHGSFGEDGTLQGFLETIDVPFVGSGVQSSVLCFNKFLTKKTLELFQVPTPKSFDVLGTGHFEERKKNGDWSETFLNKAWFIKPAREGSTVGIQRYQAGAGWDVFRDSVKKALEFDSLLLVEEWIHGAEYTVAVLFGKALPIIEIKPKSMFFDYQSKYTKGLTEYLCPAPLDASRAALMARFAERAFAALECDDLGRVDFMMGADGPLALEMNTLPGFTETSLVPKAAAAAGMDYATLCENLVCGALKRCQTQSKKPKAGHK